MRLKTGDANDVAHGSNGCNAGDGDATGHASGVTGYGLGMRTVCVGVVICTYVLLPVPMLFGYGMATALAMNFLVPLVLMGIGVVWTQRMDAKYRMVWSPIVYILLTSMASAPVVDVITGTSTDQCPITFDCYAHIGSTWLYVDVRSIIGFAILYLISCTIGVVIGVIIRTIRHCVGRYEAGGKHD